MSKADRREVNIFGLGMILGLLSMFIPLYLVLSNLDGLCK